MDDKAIEPSASPLRHDVCLTWEQCKQVQPDPLASERPETAQRKHQNPASDTAWLTPAEAAQRARLSTSHFLRMVRNGRGPVHVGKHRLLRVKRSELDAWNARGFR